VYVDERIAVWPSRPVGPGVAGAARRKSASARTLSIRGEYRLTRDHIRHAAQSARVARASKTRGRNSPRNLATPDFLLRTEVALAQATPAGRHAWQFGPNDSRSASVVTTATPGPTGLPGLIQPEWSFDNAF